MKTAKQIKKEARERFGKEFLTHEEAGSKNWGYVLFNEAVAESIKDFLDQLIDTTIKQVKDK